MRVPNMNWDRFAQELIKRYSGYDANPFELMASLEQGQQTIDSYVEQFEMLIAQIGDVPEDQSRGYFLSGLREEIWRRMIVHSPRSVDQAIMLARGLELELYGMVVDRGRAKSSLGLGWEQKGGTNLGLPNQAQCYERDDHKFSPLPTNNVKGITQGEFSHSRQTTPIFHSGSRIYSVVGGGNDRNNGARVLTPRDRDDRVISQQEFLHRRENGSCFKCGEHYHSMHRCANKILRATVLAEEDGEAEELNSTEIEEEKPQAGGDVGGRVEASNTEYNSLELPLYSVNGINQPQTLKVKVRMGDREVAVMVDSGASHNFVSKA